MNKKYVIGIVVVVVVLGLVGVFSNQGVPQQAQAPAPTTQNPGAAVEQQTVKENITGNIDDVAAVIASDAASDNVPTADSDPTTLSENDKALNDFVQSLNTQFQ